VPKKLHNALTPFAVRNAKPGRHADGGGLHLLVKESGARSWVYRFMLKGRARDIGLSRCPEAIALLRRSGNDELTLAQARDVAAIYRLKVKAGIDPLEERQREAGEALAAVQAAQIACIAFKKFAEDYIDGREHSWRNPKHRQQWRNTLATYAYPVIGDLPLAEIGTPHVLKILEPIWKAKTETASRLRGRLETILDAAKVREYRKGENPARWRGHLAEILPARTRLSRGHHKAMPYEAVPAFVTRLRDREAVAALALEFAVLTAARSGEITGATWAEVDLAKAIWTVPAGRMKAGKEHRVPLSPRAVAILKEAQKLNTTGDDSAPMFPAAKGGKLSGMAMSMLLRRMKVDATVHGFRSGFRDWSAECTGYAHEVCEMALAHVIGNKAEAAYRRGDLFEKRRRLMSDWAAYCSNGPRSDSVTPIRTTANGARN